jgi:hypothetical protein
MLGDVAVPKAKCSVETCDRPVQCRGWCSTHYARVLATGDVRAHIPIGGLPKPKMCTVESCSNKSAIRGWCATHYYRWKKTGDVRAEAPIVPRRPARCGTNGGAHAHRRRGEELCAPCLAARKAYEHRLRHSETGKPVRHKHSLKYRHGLSWEAYEELLATQGGKCALCGKSEPGGSGRWHVDHDHICCAGKRSCGKCIRGLLCAKCNGALGLLGDTAASVRNALVYLEQYELRRDLGGLGHLKP